MLQHCFLLHTQHTPASILIGLAGILVLFIFQPEPKPVEGLFNLIPLSPFDGGRITAVISPKLWLIGAPILVGLFFYRPSPLLILMALLAALQTWKAWKSLRGVTDEADRQYYLASNNTRFSYGTLYIGLAAFLATMSHKLHEELPRGP